jgi:hypothetical protein
METVKADFALYFEKKQNKVQEKMGWAGKEECNCTIETDSWLFKH